jgi:hypothetical protein
MLLVFVTAGLASPLNPEELFRRFEKLSQLFQSKVLQKLVGLIPTYDISPHVEFFRAYLQEWCQAYRANHSDAYALHRNHVAKVRNEWANSAQQPTEDDK